MTNGSRNQNKPKLADMEDTASRLTKEALGPYHIPDSYRRNMVLEVRFGDDYHEFQLRIAGDLPADSILLTSIKINQITGIAIGPVAVSNLELKALPPRSMRTNSGDITTAPDPNIPSQITNNTRPTEEECFRAERAIVEQASQSFSEILGDMGTGDVGTVPE